MIKHYSTDDVSGVILREELRLNAQRIIDHACCRCDLVIHPAATGYQFDVDLIALRAVDIVECRRQEILTVHRPLDHLRADDGRNIGPYLPRNVSFDLAQCDQTRAHASTCKCE